MTRMVIEGKDVILLKMTEEEYNTLVEILEDAKSVVAPDWLQWVKVADIISGVTGSAFVI